MNSPISPPDSPAPFVLRPIYKGIVLLLVLLACLSIIYLTPLRDFLHRLHDIRDMIQKAGYTGPAFFTGGTALLVAIGCPRLLLCPIGGMAFGFWEGLLWSQIGTLAGFYGCFLFVRWGGQEIMRRRLARWEHVARLFEKSGLLVVMFLRLMPVAGFFINILLGLTRVRHRDFLLGTALGTLPEAIPATLIGSSAISHSFMGSAQVIIIAILCLVVVWIILGWYLHSGNSGTLMEVRENLKKVIRKGSRKQ